MNCDPNESQCSLAYLCLYYLQRNIYFVFVFYLFKKLKPGLCLNIDSKDRDTHTFFHPSLFYYIANSH